MFVSGKDFDVINEITFKLQVGETLNLLRLLVIKGGQDRINILKNRADRCSEAPDLISEISKQIRDNNQEVFNSLDDYQKSYLWIKGEGNLGKPYIQKTTH